MARSTQIRRRFINLAEAEDYTGLSQKSLRNYIAAGRLTGYRLGPRALRLSLEELDALHVPIPTAAAGGAA